MIDEIRAKASKILSMALEKTIDPVTNPLRADTAKWDSLKHIELILMLEDEFKIRFSANEVNAIRSLDDIVEKIKAKNGS